MVETLRMAPEAETPVNPYSLLEAVNDSSDTAHTAWLIFLAVMTYFMIAVAGVTHKDLLLETPVDLPIMQVKVPLAQFFQFAPVVLVMMHLGVLSQLVLLARKTIEFDNAIRLLEPSDRRTHPLRLELNNVFFVQAIAGPHRSAIMSAFLHGMSWLTLVILPVMLVLYIQGVFLPYHDQTITWTHRIALIVDIGLLLLIGVFLTRAETSFFQAFSRSTLTRPMSFLSTVSVLSLAAFLSLFVATIPGEPLDKVTTAMFGPARDHRTSRDRRHEASFLGALVQQGADGSLLWVFKRYLDVTDTDLVPDKEVTPGEPSINLRGRDLKLARLDRSDLHQADFTGADLTGASLSAADLRGARFDCKNLESLVFFGDRERAGCVAARSTNFANARLDGSTMSGIDLKSAVLSNARMEGVDLRYSAIASADFSTAVLDKADLTGGVHAESTSFLSSSMKGADLTGAILYLADLSNSNLQGAVLNLARLEGAKLHDSDLEAAALAQSSLQGANLSGARIVGADFRGAHVWLTQSPLPDPSGVADLSELVIRPLPETDANELAKSLDDLEPASLKALVKEGLGPILNGPDSRKWAGTPAQGKWQALVAASQPALADTYKARLTDYLSKEMCRPRWAAGSLATGIARRAIAHQFRGDPAMILDRLKAADCAPGRLVPQRTLDSLATAAELTRAN